MCNCCCMELPECEYHICTCCTVVLGRYSNRKWKVGYGWYTWGGNRPVCGWYLTDIESGDVKPFNKADLLDIYIIGR